MHIILSTLYPSFITWLRSFSNWGASLEDVSLACRHNVTNCRQPFESNTAIEKVKHLPSKWYAHCYKVDLKVHLASSNSRKLLNAYSDS